MPIAVYALTLGGFGIGLTEFVILGLLPEVAQDFGVTDTTAGYLVSGYALSVAVGAVVLTALLTRANRKTALLGLLVLFLAGNVLSAIAPDYGTMLAGRVIAALCHGAFFGIGSVVAAGLVAQERRAGAIALMFAGVTSANVLGVPFGTLLGQAVGWRATFWAIAVIGIVAFLGIAMLIPRTDPRGANRPASLRTELSAFTSGQVWASIVVTILGYGGMFGAFTYIAFTLTEVTGFASSAVPWLLIVFGVGLFAGNLFGGKAADANLGRTLLVVLIALTAVLVVFAITAQSKPATIVNLVLLGAFGFGTVPGLQMRILNFADRAPTLASGANIAAFNIGNALGAWIGGLTLAAGLGYTSPLWAGAAVTFAGVLVFVAAGLSRGGEFRANPVRAVGPDLDAAVVPTK